MKSLGVWLIVGILINQHKCKQPDPSWVNLFNGKDLNNWVVKIKGHPVEVNFGNTYRVNNGLISVRYDKYGDFNSQFGNLYYKEMFSNYLLELEYRFSGVQSKGGPGWGIRNSGVMLHSQSPYSVKLQQEFPVSIEMQFLGGNGKDERHTGNLCTPGTNVVINDKLFRPHCIDSKSKTYHGDRWVKAQALVFADSLIAHIIESDTVLVYEKMQIDGSDGLAKMNDFRDATPVKEGYIALQSESHPVDFRNIRLFDLSPYMGNRNALVHILQKLKQRH